MSARANSLPSLALRVGFCFPRTILFHLIPVKGRRRENLPPVCHILTAPPPLCVLHRQLPPCFPEHVCIHFPTAARLSLSPEIPRPWAPHSHRSLLQHGGGQSRPPGSSSRPCYKLLLSSPQVKESGWRSSTCSFSSPAAGVPLQSLQPSPSSALASGGSALIGSGLDALWNVLAGSSGQGQIDGNPRISPLRIVGALLSLRESYCT